MGSGSRLSVNRLNDLNLSEVAVGTDFLTFSSFSKGLYPLLDPSAKQCLGKCCLSPVH